MEVEGVSKKDNEEIEQFLKEEGVLLPVKKEGKKSKIEKAGVQVMDHIMRLVRESNLSHQAIADHINKLYNLDLSRENVYYFLQTNSKALLKNITEEMSLDKVRSMIFLDHNKVLVKDIQIIDDELEKLTGEEGKMLEPDKRAKAISDLIDKKGKILIRQARLSGKLKNESGTNISNVEVNIFEKINEEKSDIIKRLKKAEFNEGKIIDVTPNENRKSDSPGLLSTSK